MASSSKRKTTMAKLNRERKLRERRLEKQAKKAARKQAAADAPGRLHAWLKQPTSRPESEWALMRSRRTACSGI